MRNGERLSLEQIRAFMKGSQEVRFEGVNRHEIYAWMTVTICERKYWKQHREVKGLLRRYMAKMTGLSRARITRPIGRYKAGGCETVGECG